VVLAAIVWPTTICVLIYNCTTRSCKIITSFDKMKRFNVVFEIFATISFDVAYENSKYHFIEQYKNDNNFTLYRGIRRVIYYILFALAVFYTDSLCVWVHNLYNGISIPSSCIAVGLKYQLHGYAVVKSLSPTITFDTALRPVFQNLSLLDETALQLNRRSYHCNDFRSAV